MEFKNEKWEVVKHSWSDTSIHNQDGKNICTLSIDDEDTTEENQEERENEVFEIFNLIVCAPEMLEIINELIEAIKNEDIIIKDNTDNDGFEARGFYFYNKFNSLIKKATTI